MYFRETKNEKFCTLIQYLDILRNVVAIHGRNITTVTLLGSETSSFILSLNCDMCDILSGPSLFFIFLFSCDFRRVQVREQKSAN